MKNLRQLCSAVTLTLVFALSTYAGEMQTPRAPEPPERKFSASHKTGPGLTSGEMFAKSALDLLQTMLSLI